MSMRRIMCFFHQERKSLGEESTVEVVLSGLEVWYAVLKSSQVCAQLLIGSMCSPI